MSIPFLSISFIKLIGICTFSLLFFLTSSTNWRKINWAVFIDMFLVILSKNSPFACDIYVSSCSSDFNTKVFWINLSNTSSKFSISSFLYSSSILDLIVLYNSISSFFTFLLSSMYACHFFILISKSIFDTKKHDSHSEPNIKKL